MRDEAVNDCLSALKFVPDWLVTNKMLEKVDNILFTNDDLIAKWVFLVRILIKIKLKILFMLDF